MQQRSDSITPLGMTLAVVVGVACVAVYWRASTHAAGADTLERMRQTGVVRVGYANEAPYGYLNSLTGEVTGEAPEIAKVILHRMGAKRIVPIVTEFGSLIPGLKAGRFDVIAAGMYVTPARAQEIRFSNPTYSIGEAFLVKAGNPLQLHSFEDVGESDRARLGVMGGSVEHGYAKAVGIPAAHIVVFPSYPSALEGLRTGRIDAFAATVLTANDLLRKRNDPQIELAQPFYDPLINGKPVRGYGAFGFRKQDNDLVREFNRHLATFIGSPEHLKLVEPFGFNRETLPGNVKTADLVEGL